MGARLKRGRERERRKNVSRRIIFWTEGKRKRPLKAIVSMIFSFRDEKTKRREFTLVSGEWGHDGTGSVIKRNCNIACLLSTSVKWPVSSRLLSWWTINRYEMLIFSRLYRDIALPGVGEPPNRSTDSAIPIKTCWLFHPRVFIPSRLILSRFLNRDDACLSFSFFLFYRTAE